MENEIKLNRKLEIAANFKAQGKYLHAIQIFEQLIREYPNNSDLIFNLAELYELSGNIDSSFDLLETYLQNNLQDCESKFHYGQLLIKKELWNKAIEVLSEIMPEEKPTVMFLLGYSYFMLKDFEMARISFLSFLSLKSDNELYHQAYIYLAKIEIEMQNYEEALQYARQSELLLNSYWELHKIFAICYYKLGMDAHSVLSIEKAIKLNPKAIELFEWAGKIYHNTGDYHKAESCFIKFIESSDNVSADTFVSLGESCLRLKKTKSAENFFELALKIAPHNNRAITALEKISSENKSSISKNA